MYKLLACILIFVSVHLSAQNVIVEQIMHQGIERNYRLAIPTAYDANKSYPLVFNLHGFGSTAAEQEFYSDMNRVGEAEGFLICYPDGIDNAWNVGWEFGSEADDVGFISTLIDEISGNYNIDSERIYSCGMSNGGFMSYRLACEMNDRIAAVASVTGSMAPLIFPDCDPGKAVSVMQIHGTADGTVPYSGDPDINIHIDTLVAFWADNNGCAEEADTSDVEDINMTDNTTVKKIQYSDCSNDSEVLFFKVDGGGHTWPGAFLNIGVTNQDIEASEEIWEFFRNKSLNDQTSSVNDISPTLALTLFPNPASDMIQIEDPDFDGNAFIIHSFSGKDLSKGTISGGKINLRTLPPGIYILSILNEEGIVSRRVVKR